MSLRIELHKAKNGQFYHTIGYKANCLDKSSEFYKNREGALEPVVTIAHEFGGRWNLYYWDCTHEGQRIRKKYKPQPRKYNQPMPVGEKESEI